MKRFSYITACLALADPSTALADPPTDVPAAAVSDSEIIVTAQHRFEKAKDVPITMTVLSSAALSAAGVKDTLGLAQITPGLTLQEQNGYVNPSIRGVSTSIVGAGTENPISVYLDGVYVSNMGASTFSLPDVEQVEVLKGPQGTLFGRNATGGAILITTKRPSFTPTGDVEVTSGLYTGAGGSRPAYDLSAKGYVSGPIVPNLLAASVSFSDRRSNGYGVNVGHGRISREADIAYGSDRVEALDDKLIRGKLLFTPTPDVSAILTGYYTHTTSDRNQGGYVALNGTALTQAELSFPNRVTPTRPWQSTYDSLKPGTVLDTDGTSLKIDWTIAGAGTVTSTTGYSYSKYQENNDSDASYIPGCLAVFACTAPYDSITSQSFQQDLLFASRQFGRFSFVSGVNYFRDVATVNVRVNDFSFGSSPLGQATNPDLFHYNQSVRTRALGLFIDGKLEITDALTISAGVRYSDEKKTGILNSYGGIDFTPGSPTFFQDIPFAPNGTPLTTTAAKKWTPRVSLVYAVDPYANIYATYSQGFKSGIIPGGALGVPEVRPEELTAYEVGFKTSRRNYTFNAAAFLYNYKNQQVSTNGAFGGVINEVANVANSRTYGLDVDGSWTVSDAFSVRGGVSWIPYAKFLSYPGAPNNVPRCINPANPNNTSAVAGPGVFCPGGSLDLSGTRLFKTPKVTVNFSAIYTAELGKGQLTITPNIYYASKLFTDPTHLDALSTDNFKLGAEIAYKLTDTPWRIALWGRNLTNDSSFASLSNNGSAFLVIPGEPMEVGLTGTFAF